VREALPGELAAIGDLRVAAYAARGFLSDGSHYTETLRGLGCDGGGQVLAAVGGEQILGTVMLQRWPDGGHVVRGPEVAGFRRIPDRDWCPVPGFTLLAYGLDLQAG